MIKKLLIIPAIVLMSQGVFADDHGRPPQDYNDQPPAQGPEYYGGAEGYYGAPPAGPCCGVAVAPPVAPCCEVVPPPPPPPPVVYNPGINYYCGYNPCPTPVVPYGPRLRPYYPRPWGGPGPGYGPRPYPYGGPIAGIPRGMVRRMSATGCEVQQGNNGEFSVISSEGAVLYKSDAQHASQNADYMKSYYEKNSDLCGVVRSPSKSLDI